MTMEMRAIAFAPSAKEDFNKWKVQHPQTFARIIELIQDIQRSPFKGIGKPEPLRHQYKGYWSRRITQGHRLVYRVETQSIIIFSCRGHY